jgi:hypothetical protein
VTLGALLMSAVGFYFGSAFLITYLKFGSIGDSFLNKPKVN